MNPGMNKRGICKECGKERYIVNAKYKCCGVCNTLRLHPEGKKPSVRKIDSKVVDSMRLARVLKNPLNQSPVKKGKVKYCSVPGCLSVVHTKGMCGVHYYKQLNENKKAAPVKTQTADERIVKSHLSKLKSKTKQKYVSENGGMCEGCCKYTGGLQYSHIISVGQRKDLELHPQNHNMLCQKCHEDWESYNPERLLALAVFYPNMEFIREHDTEKFWKIYFKFNDAMMFDVCKRIEEIDENFNKK